MSVTDIQVVEAMAKEQWPEDQMEKQFHDGHALLEEIEKKKPLEVSPRGAVTAIQTGRGGGVSMVPPTGSNDLNKADGPKVNRAVWKLGRIRNAVELDTAVVKQVSGEPKSVAAAIDLAVSDNLSTMQLQLTRQLALDGTGIICGLATNSSSTTLKLDVSSGGDYALGREAMRNGWITPGQQYDIGTLEDEDVKADGITVESVNEDEDEPKITISGSAIETTVGTHFISIRNARKGKTSYEIHGFRQLAGEGELGEIDPEDEPYWKGGFREDKEGAAITRQMVIAGRRRAKTRGKGKQPDWAFTSPEQIEVLDNEIFANVRYDSPDNPNVGSGERVRIGSLQVEGLEDSPIGDFTFAVKKYLFALRIDKPYWCGEKFGGSMFVTQPGSTYVYGDQEYFIQLCVTRRNTISQFTGLENPDS